MEQFNFCRDAGFSTAPASAHAIAPAMRTLERLPAYTQTELDTLAAAAAILSRQVRKDPLESPEITRQYLRTLVGTCRDEHFGVLFTDTRHQVISHQILASGTLDHAKVYARQVVRAALENNASCVLFYHNHPSGVAEPSYADEQLTQRLTDAMRLIDVRVLDHIVVAADETVSFAERGLL